MLEPTPIRQRKRLRALALGLGALLVAMVLSTQGLGTGVPAIAGVLGLAYALMTGGLLAFAYLAAGVALGAVVLRVLLGPAPLEAAEPSNRAWLALGFGPGLMLALSHALGVLGLLSGPVGQWVAIATLLAGVLGFLGVLSWAVRNRPNLPRPPSMGLLWVIPVGLTLVAACNPPGWLWRSEAGGYDVLSYHLQLPQEWAAGKAAPGIRPLEHNVYSFLPSAVESGYTHIAAALGAGREPLAGIHSRPGSTSVGLLAFEGSGAMGCQLLHAGFGLIAAALIGRMVWLVLRRAGLGGRVPAEIGALAGAVHVALPWVVVVSSMAYVEGAVNAMIAAGLLAVLDRRGEPVRGGLLAGLAVGLATACKPTAAFMAGPLVGLLLMTHTPMLAWWRAGSAAVAGGLLMIGPFLLRNYLACGNPIFPAATAWFGTAHWSPEQVARFAGAHTETGGLADRLALLVQTSGVGGTGLGGEPRGVFHSQWMGLFPIGIAALSLGVAWRPVRAVAAVLLGGVAASLAWWVGFSHCQSRFLLPLSVPLALGVGIGLGCVAAWWSAGMQPRAARLAMIVAGALPLFFGVASVRRFLGEQASLDAPPRPLAGFPNLDLPVGTSRRVGDMVREDLRVTPEAERPAYIDALGPEAFVNTFIDRGPTIGEFGVAGRVYLIGGATPFYLRGSASGRVVYHTTYDRSHMGEAIRMAPGRPELWSEYLRGKGIECVLVDFGELLRLSRAGWIDPDVTLDRVAGWVIGHTEVIKEWRAPGHDGPEAMPMVGLYRLAAPTPPAGGGGGGQRGGPSGRRS